VAGASYRSAPFLALVANLAMFFAYTYPMNVLTRNWSVPPSDLEPVRRQWEYSRAANAALVLPSSCLPLL
jgi:hypothetical protein